MNPTDHLFSPFQPIFFMKSFLKSGLLAIASAALLFSACNKGDDKTPEELLTGTDWLVAFIDYKEAGETTWTIEEMDACDVDNIFKFGTDDIVTIDAGAIKCDPTGPQQVDSQPYTLSADGKIFEVDGEAYVVETLTKSKFVITLTDSGDVERITFKAK